ncbi:DarT ssDNA thymidine ADP-ribosyltransferase family protein [Lacisediminihabitans changchengi]|uniref:DUF4433 domain-containing protein n=1 Tax=Lacisediminihabitans changchengi TaxID=2787634 RepID=A0A934W378_9MICO|nr:DarT ssDNA thymidine ADP-ribosyltransferase family protein [Lacisediminihabitans changchengi]MBK4346909.1 DUF4433 domain-containing protein [Lacisediminihabitans changchengi]MBK4347968.1 DUF4433 domain-containing protein [Lacisediminihabitans changchengi]
MPDECIHGLEAGLCDLCYPKAKPEVAPVATTTRTTTRRRTPAVPRTAGVGTPDHKVGEQRLYHVTHISNLAGIIEAGSIVAPATPALDASSPENRDARRNITLEGATVADYVPFFLSPNSTIWSQIRAGADDPRLSREVRDLPPAEFVILVSTVKVATALESAISVSDGDPSSIYTRFGTTPETNDRTLRKLRADDALLLEGELLIRDAFPFDQIALIGVANDRARDAVREILQTAMHEPKVAVYPPWFARA